jgi:hypothetical protein
MGIKAGEIIEGPDGQGYRVTRDIQIAQPVLITDLEPFGGAPEPKDYHVMPPWLAKWFEGKMQ